MVASDFMLLLRKVTAWQFKAEGSPCSLTAPYCQGCPRMFAVVCGENNASHPGIRSPPNTTLFFPLKGSEQNLACLQFSL